MQEDNKDYFRSSPTFKKQHENLQGDILLFYCILISEVRSSVSKIGGEVNLEIMGTHIEVTKGHENSWVEIYAMSAWLCFVITTRNLSLIPLISNLSSVAIVDRPQNLWTINEKVSAGWLSIFMRKQH